MEAEDCAKYYNYPFYYNAGFDQSSLICAGDTVNGNDTCEVGLIQFFLHTLLCALGYKFFYDELIPRMFLKGDSGGPLQVEMKNEPCMYLQFGITSRGPQECGNTIPAVYTRVGYYIEWIQSIVWPQMN